MLTSSLSLSVLSWSLRNSSVWSLSSFFFLKNRSSILTLLSGGQFNFCEYSYFFRLVAFANLNFTCKRRAPHFVGCTYSFGKRSWCQFKA